MKKHDQLQTDRRTAFGYIALVLAIGLGLELAPHAQNVWNDVRHEVTVRNDPQSFSCTVVNNNATTLTAFGGSCVAPTVNGQSFYITDIIATASAASTTTANQYLEVESGTGGTCGTGTAVVWAAYNAAMSGPASAGLTTPIKVAANSELCWMDAVAGSKTFIVSGYVK
jgi:hypothetical protein